MIDSVVNGAVKKYLEFRYRNIEKFKLEPHAYQEKWRKKILDTAKKTEYGKLYEFSELRSYNQFNSRIPILKYEDIYPYIKKMLSGDANILWPGKIDWFSKSSGTTNDKSKYIPVSSENLKECHIKGPWDSMAIYINKYPDSKLFKRKNVVMGGSLEKSKFNDSIQVGDISAIMLHQMPSIGQSFSTPGLDIALMDDWEEKIEKMASVLIKEDIGMFGGVPTWTIVLFNRMLEMTGKDTISEIWPNAEAYFHGGVGFEPYLETFTNLMGPDHILNYQEAYNASEGYFAVQDLKDSDDMLLLLNNGIFYEFIPMDEFGNEDSEAIPLEGVKTGVTYAMIISSNSGLWRYDIGDTVQFTSLDPYRIKISGRTKQFINAFGEEVMVGNTDKAIAITSKQTESVVGEYTVAPVYLKSDSRGCHEWVIEFKKAPQNISEFANTLDRNLQKLNSDYQAKRTADLALTELKITPVQEGVFHEWMKSRGKLGGQNKVPRLSMERKYVEEILRFVSQN